MSHDQCDQFGQAILRQFGNQQKIGYSVGPFDGDWDNLITLVEKWWEAFKVWEAQDTLVAAYAEQRLTVKGTSTMDSNIQAFVPLGEARDRYNPGVNWGDSRTFGTKIVKTNASIKARMDPKVFRPGKDMASEKTTKGFHDLSALLLNPKAPISQQQYKGGGDIPAEQVFVFMPVSHASDQAVFQNINTLAKAHRGERGDFYDLVRSYRAQMTRIKLAAEHDMAVNFVLVSKPDSLGPPKFKYTLLTTTDISARDEKSGIVPPKTFLNKLTTDRVIQGLTKRPDPPLDLEVGDRARLANTLLETDYLKSLLDKPFDPVTLREKVEAILNKPANRLKLAQKNRKYTGEILDRCVELLLENAGGKTLQAYPTTPGIYEARQRAAINYHTMVLGQMNRYAELTVAYRNHASNGAFPKFACFDKLRKLWLVGDVDEQNVWTARQSGESFSDRPV